MKNRDAILVLINQSINAFGEVLGLGEQEKLRKILIITQNTIQESFGIDSSTLSVKTLDSILEKKELNILQAQLLTSLLLTQAEVLFKLNRMPESLLYYKNTLLLLQWKSKQTIDKELFEIKDKMLELENIITTFKDSSKITNLK